MMKDFKEFLAEAKQVGVSFDQLRTEVEDAEEALNDAGIKTSRGPESSIWVDKGQAKKANAVLKKINALDPKYNFTTNNET